MFEEGKEDEMLGKIQLPPRQPQSHPQGISSASGASITS